MSDQSAALGQAAGRDHLGRVDPGGADMRWIMHLLPVGAAVFLYVYSRAVCPFIDGLDAARLFTGLAVVTVVHLAFRVVAERLFPVPRDGVGPARHGFRLAVATWGLAGAVAVAVHALRYPDFPLASHLKLLLGYWVLGGGVMAQFEYVFLERLLRRQGIVSAAAYDGLGRRLLESFFVFTLAPAGAMVLLVFRYVLEGLVIPGIAGEVMFLAVVLIAGALGVAWHYGRTLREDTRRLVAALEQIGDGRFDVRLDVTRPDELGRIAQGINAMAAGLRQREVIRDAFGRFVSPEVAEAFLRAHTDSGNGIGSDTLGGTRRDVTVLLCDLRGFTALSESLEPEVLTDLLNTYFTEMVDVVRAHGGLVDKFIGDAMMVVFGLAGEGVAEHPGRAVACARDLRARLAAFNEHQMAKGRPTLEHGIGLHSGPVVAGTIGSPERLEFTVIGATVNTAARIQSAARPPYPPILMSAETAQRLSGRVPTTAVATVRFKGLDEPTMLYGLA